MFCVFVALLSNGPLLSLLEFCDPAVVKVVELARHCRHILPPRVFPVEVILLNERAQ